MLLKAKPHQEMAFGFDRFENPFLHDAFLRAGEGCVTAQDLQYVSHTGYTIPYEVERFVSTLGARVARFAAHGYAPIGGAFAATDAAGSRSEQSFHETMDLFAAQSSADLMLWPYFPLDAREYHWLESWLVARMGASAFGSVLVSRRHERALLRCETGQEGSSGFGLKMSRNKRKTTGRQRRRLDDLGKVRFVSTDDGFDQAQAIATFLKVEASGWKGIKGTALSSDAKLQTFVKGFLPQMLAENRAQIDLMLLEDYCISGVISFRAGRGLFTWKTGMDEVFKRYSPGVQVLIELSQRAISDPTVDYVDSLADSGHPVAEHIWGCQRPLGFLFIPLNPVGRLACHSLRTGYVAKDAARYWAKRALGRV